MTVSAHEEGAPGGAPASVTSAPAPSGRSKRGFRGKGIASPRAIAWRVYAVAFAAAAAMWPLRHVTVAGEAVDLTFMLAALGLVAAHVAYSLLLRRSLERHTYDWYARVHAVHMQPGGRVACRHCGGVRITQQSLTGVRFLAQICGNCKRTLFFRPERRTAAGARGAAGAPVAGQPACWEGPERRQSARPGPSP